MSRNKYIIILFFSIILIISAFIIENLMGTDVKVISGIMLGLGAGLFGMSVAKLIELNYLKKNPLKAKEQTIELKDERNIYIRYKAKAKAGDITGYLLIALAFICIVAKLPVWVTMSLIGVYVVNFIIQLVFLSIIQKEM